MFLPMETDLSVDGELIFKKRNDSVFCDIFSFCQLYSLLVSKSLISLRVMRSKLYYIEYIIPMI